ncbi:flagellar hook-length control protein FliK [Pseudomonas sp. dw_358]|uniref:flagellar hook-length control protein FliK n=1 Tax=Pseudomonas sp. dw_358 TaxID=2720083 RepID=UPI001BD4BF02|nr:flagellar hook-length control protein FliK [Pseudomonas sp. dw_358]
MTSEITSIAPASTPATVTVPTAVTAAVRNAAMTSELLQLVQPEAVVATGETAPGQVLDLKQAGQAFEVLLQVTLASGRQTTVQTTSNQPLLPGTQVSVSQPTTNSLAITVQQAHGDAVASLTEIDTAQLPVGTLLQGKVVTTQVMQPGVWRSLVTLLNTPQAGAILTLDSPQPLRLGSLLSAQVQGSQQLQFVPLSGRLDQLAVSQQLAGQQARQASLPSLLAAIASFQQSQAAALPVDANDTLTTLLANLPQLPDMADPRVVAQALQGSGTFMEPALLAGQAAALPADLKTTLLRLVAQLTPLLAANSSFNPLASNAAALLAQNLPGYVRNALGMLGQVSAKAQPVSFPLTARVLGRTEGETDVEGLLRLASAAISRLQSHQLSSLEQTGINDQGRLQTTWQLEIPMRNAQDFVPLQVKLQREDLPDDDAPPQREHSREAREAPAQAKLWRVELAFDLEPLGPLQVQAQLLHGTLSSDLWAERAHTAELIHTQLGELRSRLLDCGLNVTDINCHQGVPPRGPRTHLEQRWVDETA